MSPLIRALCLIGFVAWSGPLAAQEFPSRPIKFIVPFPAGGPADTISRIVTEKMSSILGQPIVIEARAGAGGIIGVETTARSAPDGYTLVMGHIGTHAVNPSLYSKMPYDAVRDFAPVALVMEADGLLVIHPSVPAKTSASMVESG